MQISAFRSDWHGWMFFSITPQNWHRRLLSLWSDPFSDAAPVSVMSSIKLVLYFPAECFKFSPAMMRDIGEMSPSHDSFFLSQSMSFGLS